MNRLAPVTPTGTMSARPTAAAGANATRGSDCAVLAAHACRIGAGLERHVGFALQILTEHRTRCTGACRPLFVRTPVRYFGREHGRATLRTVGAFERRSSGAEKFSSGGAVGRGVSKAGCGRHHAAERDCADRRRGRAWHRCRRSRHNVDRRWRGLRRFGTRLTRVIGSASAAGRHSLQLPTGFGYHRRRRVGCIGAIGRGGSTNAGANGTAVRPTNRQRLNNSARLRGRDGARCDAQRDAFSGGGLGDQTPEPL